MANFIQWPPLSCNREPTVTQNVMVIGNVEMSKWYLTLTILPFAVILLNEVQ
jgi:hypothetical protein